MYRRCLSFAVVLLSLLICAVNCLYDPTVPDIFYPFGEDWADTAKTGDDEKFELTNPFIYLQVSVNGYVLIGLTKTTVSVYNTDLVSPPGNLYYRLTNDSSLLTRANNDIRQSSPSLRQQLSDFRATWLFIATWYNVSHYQDKSLTFTFQCVLVGNSSHRFAVFNYGTISSLPVIPTIGFKNDAGMSEYTPIVGSQSQSDVVNRSNVGVPGRFVFRLNITPVRLVAGVSTISSVVVREGRLEIYYNEEWGTVCDKRFTNTNAAVVCRMFDYGFAGQVISNKYGPGTGRIWMDDVRCNGTETHLEDCAFNGWGISSCGHDEDVAIRCFISTAGTVRLVDSTTPGQGRLEVRYSISDTSYDPDKWGTVCDDGFDDTDASVACYELAYDRSGKVISNKYGLGTGQIWLNKVRCIGSELSLFNCAHDDWGVHNCTHNQDVSISCNTVTNTTVSASEFLPSSSPAETSTTEERSASTAGTSTTQERSASTGQTELIVGIAVGVGGSLLIIFAVMVTVGVSIFRKYLKIRITKAKERQLQHGSSDHPHGMTSDGSADILHFDEIADQYDIIGDAIADNLAFDNDDTYNRIPDDSSDAEVAGVQSSSDNAEVDINRVGYEPLRRGLSEESAGALGGEVTFGSVSAGDTVEHEDYLHTADEPSTGAAEDLPVYQGGNDLYDVEKSRADYLTVGGDSLTKKPKDKLTLSVEPNTRADNGHSSGDQRQSWTEDYLHMDIDRVSSCQLNEDDQPQLHNTHSLPSLTQHED